MKINRPSGQTALDILGKDKETAIKELNSQYDFVGEIKINELIQFEIEKIEVEEQVRTEFDEAELNELAEDIKENGIIQPLIVRPENEKYILVIGERRYRASKIAGLKYVPCVVKNIKKEDVPLLQLFENIQRKDLTWDELNRVMRGFADKGMSLQQIAEKIHKNKSFVQRYLAVSKLDDAEKEKLKQGAPLSKVIEASKIKDPTKKKEVLDNINGLSRDKIGKINKKSKPRKPSKDKENNGVFHGETPPKNQVSDGQPAKTNITNNNDRESEIRTAEGGGDNPAGKSETQPPASGKNQEPPADFRPKNPRDIAAIEAINKSMKIFNDAHVSIKLKMAEDADGYHLNVRVATPATAEQIVDAIGKIFN